METLADIVAGNIRRLRKELKLTREQLAQRAGIEPANITNWESTNDSQRRWPKPFMFEKLASALGVTVSSLMEDPSINTSNKQPTLDEALKVLEVEIKRRKTIPEDILEDLTKLEERELRLVRATIRGALKSKANKKKESA